MAKKLRLSKVAKMKLSPFSSFGGKKVPSPLGDISPSTMPKPSKLKAYGK